MRAILWICAPFYFFTKEFQSRKTVATLIDILLTKEKREGGNSDVSK